MFHSISLRPNFFCQNHEMNLRFQSHIMNETTVECKQLIKTRKFA